MAAHFNLSCNDLKFRWKIEPIKKEEEKLRVLIEGEESALQKLSAQRESAASCASNTVADTGDGKASQKTEDSRQETVLRLRCERRRKKLAEMHSRKLEILWDYVEEWLKLEVDRLSAENFLKKHPSVKKLAKYYIKYPRDILGEEELWMRVESIMTKKAVERPRRDETEESEDIAVERAEQRCVQLEVAPNTASNNGSQVHIDPSQTADESVKTERAPIQESASKFAEDPDLSEIPFLWGEDYLTQVTNTSCPWQHGCAARADWELAKTLQLEPDCLETSFHTSKAFLDEPHRRCKPKQTNVDEVNGATSSTAIAKEPQRCTSSNNFQCHRETTLAKTRNSSSVICSNTSSRRGRGGYMKQQQKFSKNRMQNASQEGNALRPCSPPQTEGKIVKSYAKALAESRPSVTLPPIKKGNESFATAETNSEKNSRDKRVITSVHRTGSCKPSIAGDQRFTKDETTDKPTTILNDDESSDDIHTQVCTGMKSPNKSDKSSKHNSVTSFDKRKKTRRPNDATSQNNQLQASKPTNDETTKTKEPVERNGSSLKCTHEICHTKCNFSESSECIKSSIESQMTSAEPGNDRSPDTIASLQSNSASKMIRVVPAIERAATKSCKGASTSPTAAIEPLIAFIGIDNGDEIGQSVSDEQSENLYQLSGHPLSEGVNGELPIHTDSTVAVTQATPLPNTQNIDVPKHTEQDNDEPNIAVPPLDLSGLSNDSEDNPSELTVVSLVGDTYDRSIIIGDSFEPPIESGDVKLSRDVSPPVTSDENRNDAETRDSSVFDFFFQGHSTRSKLPEGFPQFDTPCKEVHASRFSPLHCQRKAVDFKPFQNSWLGGLPGTTVPILSPGRIDGYSHIWSNSYQPKPMADGWSSNEEASNHLKRMLRIKTEKTPGDSQVNNGLVDAGSAVDESPAQNYSQFLNGGKHDTKDRGDPHLMHCKVLDGDTYHDPLHLTRASYSVSKTAPPTFTEKVPYHDEVPQRLRKSDSDEDFGSYFPSSSIFDSSFGI